MPNTLPSKGDPLIRIPPTPDLAENQLLLSLTESGLYCAAGDFHIDPHRPVPRAIVTHAHADHCRPGHEAMLATPETVRIARTRYGETAFASTQDLPYGQRLRIGEAEVTLYPAGHVLGSAQILIEAHGRREVVSGDYKRRADPSCTPFEPIACDLFVTEATFGLPVFTHPDSTAEIARLLANVAKFPERCHAIGAYALGKAQRLIMELRAAGYDRTIWLHGALEKLCTLYGELGLDLGPLAQATAAESKSLKGEIVLAPPGALADRWARRLPDPVITGASGWMRVRQRAKQRGVELALVISDHADWPELIATIKDTGASEIWVTHGAEEALCHWCTSQGITARPLALAGRDEEDA